MFVCFFDGGAAIAPLDGLLVRQVLRELKLSRRSKLALCKKLCTILALHTPRTWLDRYVHSDREMVELLFGAEGKI